MNSLVRVRLVFSLSSLLNETFGRYSVNRLEGSREVKRVFETEFKGDVFDQVARGQKKRSGMAHF